MSVVISLSSFFSSCAPPATEITTITPQAAEQTVTVRGKVITIAPLINQAAYEVQDAQGNSIWVLTRGKAPQLQSEVNATGKVKFESIAVDGIELAQVHLEE